MTRIEPIKNEQKVKLAFNKVVLSKNVSSLKYKFVITVGQLVISNISAVSTPSFVMNQIAKIQA
jgi:hypothetical protein